ncbi:hypothetical protein BDF19DRAFT_436067 [Syncephalis fuscata]|nr:hypothetical protein BDF19DRAFT_436067 [Syncephalis fuscata]
MACRVSLHITHPQLIFRNLQLRNVNGTVLPQPTQCKKATAFFDVPPQGMLFYRVKHAELAPVPGDPHIYFAMAWIFDDKKRKLFFADLIYIEQTVDAGPDDIAGLLVVEIHRRGIGHPCWQGYLSLGGVEAIGCALRVRCSNMFPALIEISMSALQTTSSQLRNNFTLEPPLWHTTTSPPFTTAKGQRANDRLIQYLSANHKHNEIPSTIVILENVHPQLYLHQEPCHPHVLSEATVLEENSNSLMVMPEDANAFVAFGGAAQYAQTFYLVHAIKQGNLNASTASNGLLMPYSYLIVTWTPAGMSRQLYAVEILNTRLPLNPHSPGGFCALLLITALSRAERGHCIQREVVLPAPSKANIAVAAYLSLTWSPVLLLDIASIEKSTQLSRQNSHLSTRTMQAQKSNLPSIKISIENAHPSLSLLDVQCLTTDGNYMHAIDDPEMEIDEIVSGGLLTFVFTPRSNRQLGILLFSVQAAQPIAKSPLLAVAWPIFHANIMEDNGNGGLMECLMFAKQSEGTLANGMEFTVTTTLRRHWKRKELEATICFSGNLSRSENEDILSHVRNTAAEEAGEELVIVHQNTHSGLTMLNTQMYLFTGKVIERPKASVHINDELVARAKYDKNGANNLDGSVKGFIVAQLANAFGTKRTFFVNAMTFTKPPIPRLKDKRIRARLFRQLIEPRLCMAGKDVIHHRMVFQNAPGIFLGATLNHKSNPNGDASVTLLHAVLRKASNLPLYALSAAPTLAQQRRTIRTMKRRETEKKKAIPNTPSVKIVDNESISNVNYLWPPPGSNNLAVEQQQEAGVKQNYASSERSILIMDGSVTVLNDDDSICAQLFTKDEPASNSKQELQNESTHQASQDTSEAYNFEEHHSKEIQIDATFTQDESATKELLPMDSSLTSNDTADTSKSMDQSGFYGKIGLVPDNPPILDPLNFSNYRLEEVFQLFCNTDTPAVNINTDPNYIEKGKAQIKSPGIFTPSTAGTCQIDMLPLLLNGDVQRPRLYSIPSNASDSLEPTCRMTIVNRMANATVKAIGHHIAPGAQLLPTLALPSDHPDNTDHQPLDWMFAANDPCNPIDVTIVCTVDVADAMGCLFWVTRIIVKEDTVSIGIATKRNNGKIPIKISPQTLQQIHEVVICNSVTDGSIYRVFKLTHTHNLIIHGLLTYGMSPVVH